MTGRGKTQHNALVRRSDGWVLRLLSGSMRARFKQNETDETTDIVPVPDDYDKFKTYRLVDGVFVQEDPPVEPRHILGARKEEFRYRINERTSGGRVLDPEWAEYYRKLRDITEDGKGGKDRSAAGMIRRFPKRPDGTDAIENLRNR